MYAALQGHEEAVDILIQANANVHAECTVGRLTNSTLLAAENGHSKIVGKLMSAGVDIETKDEFGITPLMHAAKKGHADCVEILLNAGANIEYTNDRNLSAKGYARTYEQPETLKLLRQAQLDLIAQKLQSGDLLGMAGALMNLW